MEEILATVKAIRDKSNQEREFQAAIQGVDLDESSISTTARDITTLSGREAVKAGFGIGMGLGYESISPE